MGGGGLEEGSEEVQTFNYQINKSQECNVQHMEYNRNTTIILFGNKNISKATATIKAPKVQNNNFLKYSAIISFFVFTLICTGAFFFWKNKPLQTCVRCVIITKTNKCSRRWAL